MRIEGGKPQDPELMQRIHALYDFTRESQCSYCEIQLHGWCLLMLGRSWRWAFADRYERLLHHISTDHPVVEEIQDVVDKQMIWDGKLPPREPHDLAYEVEVAKIRAKFLPDAEEHAQWVREWAEDDRLAAEAKA